MVAIIGRGHLAVAVTQEACHGLGRMQCQWLLKDVQALAHGGGGAVVMVERFLLLSREGECQEAEE